MVPGIKLGAVGAIWCRRRRGNQGLAWEPGVWRGSQRLAWKPGFGVVARYGIVTFKNGSSQNFDRQRSLDRLSEG